MALINCKECNKEISSKATQCPHCGVKVGGEFGKIGCAIIFALLFLPPMITNGLRASKSTTSAEEEKVNQERRVADEACFAAQKYVKEQLKAPATAKFPACREVRKSDDNNTFLVFSYVDSQNGFGAMIRSEFAVKMKKDNDGWTLTDIAIDDK